MAGEDGAAAPEAAQPPADPSPGSGGGGGYDGKCVFCRIGRREEPGTALLPCESEGLVCFRDIRPGAPHHYLVVPIEHMGNCKTLKKEHIPLVEKMMEAGKNILQQNNFTDLNDIRMGFHWPPFCSISHLHLHVLAPASQLGFLSRMIYRINSYWFITAEQLIERLQTENAAS
ncbi:adenosine 5'-monophosphoramidase HINT3 [Chrysemys picta bellii]|uniref:Adenosine 5'-monophosphoramidase HINT3 n=1 Tax=Chrysemys picta bellii TaxID=8478 RepID=A0A8C3HZH4_CHRPI|nr:histidine triad nucleotide-binding protein 3 [Chrysemys picta bellii]